MEFTEKPTFETPELTPELAMIAYGKMKVSGNADLAFKESNEKECNCHFKQVDKEGDRIFKELRSGCLDSTQTVLLSAVTSDLLDVSVLLEDDKNSRTYAQYVQDNTPEEVI